MPKLSWILIQQEYIYGLETVWKDFCRKNDRTRNSWEVQITKNTTEIGHLNQSLQVFYKQTVWKVINGNRWSLWWIKLRHKQLNAPNRTCQRTQRRKTFFGLGASLWSRPKILWESVVGKEGGPTEGNFRRKGSGLIEEPSASCGMCSQD